MGYPVAALESERARLRKRLERERRSRLEAETIAEKSLRSLYKTQHEVKLLQEIAVAANEASSIEDVMCFALQRVCTYTGWPTGHVYLCKEDETGRIAIPTALWHPSDPASLEQLCPLSKETSIPLGIGLAGQVVASGEPAWIGNFTSDGDCPGVCAAQECGLKAAAAFPVLAGKDVVAVLEFFSHVPGELDASVLGVMRHVGTQLGRVIERKRYEDKLVHDAFHDPLTKLPNRALFLDRLARCVARAKRRADYKFAVLFVDIDRFKMVNDSLGHLAGDRLIVEIAQRLSRSIRREDLVSRPADAQRGGEDTLARLGGDEFTILLDDIRDASDGVRVAERIQKHLASPFLLSGQELFTTASIGIALSATGYSAAEDMLRDADIAMYRAKALGKSRCEVFDLAMHASAVSRLKLESDLRRAIEREEFRIHYQPIVSLGSNRITGFEALVRWQRPESGLLMPGEFVPVAEETGLIVFIGKWVLREACRQMHAWNLQFPSDPALFVAVNLSAKQFAQPDLVCQVAQSLRETGLDPRNLRLELTESVSMRDVERTAGILAEFKALGIRLSIDDFGTGYSSLSYLRRFPLDTLKIDRSFISDIDDNRENREIVQTIMTLASHLGMEVVAEGVETAEQVNHLKSLACEYAQGYFFSKPMDQEAVLQKLLAPELKR